MNISFPYFPIMKRLIGHEGKNNEAKINYPPEILTNKNQGLSQKDNHQG
jgi:hypothetical protein